MCLGRSIICTCQVYKFDDLITYGDLYKENFHQLFNSIIFIPIVQYRFSSGDALQSKVFYYHYSLC